MIRLRTNDDDMYGTQLKEGDEVPTGLTVVTTEHTFEHKGKVHNYIGKVYTFPELGSPRLYDSLDELVVAISGQNYTIRVELDDDDEIPQSAEVVLVPTDSPASEGELYDEAQYNLKRLAQLKKEYAEDLKEYEEETDEEEKEYHKRHLDRDKQNIESIESGESAYSHNRPVQIFGQPQFIQNPIVPSHEGRSAFHLVTLNNDWGDSGNVNIMVALDDKGVPVKAFFEASCY